MKARLSKIQNLLSAYHVAPCTELRDQVIRLHMGLVFKVIYQTHQTIHPERAIEAAAIRGLSNAIDDYHPDQPQTFSHFAVPYIRRELLNPIWTTGIHGVEKKFLVTTGS